MDQAEDESQHPAARRARARRQVLRRDPGDRQRDQRLDRRDWNGQVSGRRQAQRDAVGNRERRYRTHQLADAHAGQDQREQEKQMVPADEDVFDPEAEKGGDPEPL